VLLCRLGRICRGKLSWHRRGSAAARGLQPADAGAAPCGRSAASARARPRSRAGEVPCRRLATAARATRPRQRGAGLIRVLTQNLWGMRGDWEARRAVLIDGLFPAPAGSGRLRRSHQDRWVRPGRRSPRPGVSGRPPSPARAGRPGRLDRQPMPRMSAFVAGRQSLDGMSVCYRDAWQSKAGDHCLRADLRPTRRRRLGQPSLRCLCGSRASDSAVVVAGELNPPAAALCEPGLGARLCGQPTPSRARECHPSAALVDQDLVRNSCPPMLFRPLPRLCRRNGNNARDLATVNLLARRCRRRGLSLAAGPVSRAGLQRPRGRRACAFRGGAWAGPLPPRVGLRARTRPPDPALGQSACEGRRRAERAKREALPCENDAL
jgi:hypothetical protein